MHYRASVAKHTPRCVHKIHERKLFSPIGFHQSLWVNTMRIWFAMRIWSALCVSDSLATHGAIQICFDWLIDWFIDWFIDWYHWPNYTCRRDREQRHPISWRDKGIQLEAGSSDHILPNSWVQKHVPQTAERPDRSTQAKTRSSRSAGSKDEADVQSLIDLMEITGSILCPLMR